MNQFPGSLSVFRNIPSSIPLRGANARSLALCVLVCVAALGLPVLAQTPTTTALAVTGSGSAVTTVPMGAVVTLTAKVTAGSTPVSPGQVNFCDATAPHCEDIHVVGTAQLTSAGIATIKIRPGVGSRSYKAVFLGTPNGSPARAGSTSANGSLTVTAPAQYPSTTVMTVSGSTGAYQLSAFVSGIGAAPPAGTVSFLDTSNGYAQLGSAALGSPSSSINFANVSNPATGSSPVAITVADFNLDGIPDMAVANYGNGNSNDTLTILLGKGDGTFAPSAANPATGQGPKAIAVGDFNGDGIPDLAVANYTGNSITILLGNGDGTFKAGVTITAPTVTLDSLSPAGVSVGDFNGDGNLDLAVLSAYDDTFTVTIFLGNGDGTFTQGSSTPAGTTTAGNSPSSFAVADFNQDGKLDVLVVSYDPPEYCTVPAYCGTGGDLTVLLGNGDGTFKVSTLDSVLGPKQISITVADFNGDGIPDVADAGGDLLLGNGDGTFTAGTPLAATGSQISVGDLNGDGIPDLVVIEPDTLSPGGYLTALFGEGGGLFSTPLTYQLSLSPFGLSVGDLNGDGLQDIAIPALGGNAAIVLLTQTQFASTPQTPIVLNGVGTDLIEASYSGDTNYAASTSVTTPLNRSSVAPTVTLAASADTVTYGTFVTLTSTVTGSGPAPTGIVTFYDGGVFVGTGTLTNGSAAYSQIFTGGLHSFTATYSGDNNYPSTNSANSVGLTVNPATPTITWSQPASIAYGTDLIPPTSPLNGSFSYSPALALVSALNVGMHTIPATFTPLDSTDYTIATDTINVTVTQAAPRIFLTSSSNPVAPSTPVTFIASVLIGYGTATGSVSFYDGAILLGSGVIGNVGLLSESAAVTTSNLSPGTHSISAVYSGDSNCLPVTSAVLTETVPEPPPGATTSTLAITSNGGAATTVPMDTVVTLTATVTSGGAPVSPGQVKFCDATAAHCEDSHIIGTAQLTSAGTATIKTRPGVGSHSYNAVFLGTPNSSTARTGSTSANIALSVSAPAQYPSITTMSVASPTGSYQLGASVSGIGSVPPTGTISFLDTTNGNAQLGSASLSSASSSFGLAAASNPATGTYPAAIAVADFNMDGIPDIATVNGQSRVNTGAPNGSLSILLGKGDGTFSTALTSATSSLVLAVVTGDFNGDGIPDLALMNTQGPMTILLGNGDGTFKAAPSPPLVPASEIVVGDFNGDGNQDIAVLNTPQITILLGHGDGTFTLGPTTALSNGTASLTDADWFAVGDFNGDGKLDIAAIAEPYLSGCTVEFTCGPGGLMILLGNGDGTFTALPTNYVLGQFPLTIAAADLNGDGIPDLAITDQDATQNGQVDLLIGNGDGTFTPQSPINLGADQPQFLVAGDFKGDGIADLALTMGGISTVTGFSDPDSVTVLIGNGDGTFASSPYQVVPPGVTGLDAIGGIAAGDFNGDGLPDLAITDFNLNTATILESQTQFGVAPPQTAVTLIGAKTHLVEASYSGDSNYTASTSATAALNLDGTAVVSMTVSANAITYGTSETLTATVTGSGPTPTGTVGFYNNFPSVGGAPLSYAQGYLTGIPLIDGVATYTSSTIDPFSVPLVVAVYSGDNNYPSANSSAVGLTVNKDTPTITWPLPASIEYGTPLPPAGQTPGVAGTFSYSPGLYQPINVGTDTVTATFTPYYANDYATATDTATITVTKATPTITLVTNLNPNTIGFSSPVNFCVSVVVGKMGEIGAATGTVSLYDGNNFLGSTTQYVTTAPCLNGTADFVISTLSAGTHSITAVYSGDSNCLPVTSAPVTLTITGGATPAITWLNPSPITYGTALSSTQLNATSTVAGSFVYTPAAGTVLGAGSHTLSVTFTPTDTTDYTTATSTVSLTVSQATPTITWAAPAPIGYGTALSVTQLNPTSTTAGSFVYTPAAGTILSPGTQTLAVAFTPTDSADFKTAASSVMLAVNQAAPTIALTSSASTAFVLNPVIFTATVSSPAGTPTGTVAFYDGMTLLSTSSMTSGIATYQTSALLAGTHSITAVYSGDTNFMTETSSVLSQVIENFTIGSSGGTSSVAASPGGQAVYTFTVTPPTGTTFAGPISFSVTGLPAGATAAFSPTTVLAGAEATTVTMTVTLAANAAVRPAEKPFPGGAPPMALGLILLPFGFRLRRRMRGWAGTVCLLVIGVTLAATITSCGSGGSGGGGGGGSSTQPQNYTLTVTATAGSLSNTFALGLTVE